MRSIAASLPHLYLTFQRKCDAGCSLPVTEARGFLRRLKLRALGARPNVVRAFYAVLFALFVVAMGALEVASSRATARIADYLDPPPFSASPSFPGR